MIHLEWWQALGVMAALAGWGGVSFGKRRGFDRGVVEGYKHGILDATPWTCEQGHANPGNNLMCCACGIDRFDDDDVLRNWRGL